MILVGADGTMYRYVEACGSFRGTYSSKAKMMEEMEYSTSTDSENFHVLPCKLLLTYMEVN